MENRRSPKLNRPAYAGLIAEDKAYVEYENDERELYDLGADPYQLENVYPGAEPTRKEGLATRLAALKGCAAETCRTAEDEPQCPRTSSTGSLEESTTKKGEEESRR